MADPTPPTDGPDGSVCPWCSAAVTPDTVTCPSCNAVLISDEEPDLPGVTAVDDKVLRGEKPPPTRNRLLSWISGEYPDQVVTPADAQAIAPPDPQVQREIRRLEYEAEVASLQAEADALLSEAVVEGRVVEVPEGIQPLELDEVTAQQTDDGSIGDDAEPSDAAVDTSAADDAAAAQPDADGQDGPPQGDAPSDGAPSTEDEPSA